MKLKFMPDPGFEVIRHKPFCQRLSIGHCLPDPLRRGADKDEKLNVGHQASSVGGLWLLEVPPFPNVEATA